MATNEETRLNKLIILDVLDVLCDMVDDSYEGIVDGSTSQGRYVFRSGAREFLDALDKVTLLSI